MRLLVDARPLVDRGYGGVTRVARALVSAYVRSFPEDDVVLATTGSRRNDLRELPSGTNCHAIQFHAPNKLWTSASMLRVASFDRTFEHLSKSSFDATFLPNLGFIGRMNKPYVLLLHDVSFLIEPRWFSRRMKLWHDAVGASKQILGAKHLLSVSETTKQDTMRLLGIPAERISVIPIGSSMTPSGTWTPSRERFVLILGGRDPRKNARTAVEAVARLKREATFADIQPVLVGGDFRPDDQELTQLYRTASTVLYPSWYEGYGLPLHEAAAFGTPCIASTAGALPETAPRGTIFADPAKPQHWVEALRETLEMPTRTETNATTETWNEAARILRSSLLSSI